VLCGSTSKAAEELLHFRVIASHYKKQALRAVLENQSDVQSHADFKEAPRQLAETQSLMTMRMTEIPLHALQRQPNSATGLFGINADARAERPA
jgi:hypothetical protein